MPTPGSRPSPPGARSSRSPGWSAPCWCIRTPATRRLPTDPEAMFASLEGDDSPGGVQARWILTLAMSSHRVTAELRQRATVDALTGLVNRVGFTEALRSHLVHADGPAAVLLFDLDRFKQVNDAYGHSVGDAVLVVGRRCAAPHHPRRRRRRPLRWGRVRRVVPRARRRRPHAHGPACRTATRGGSRVHPRARRHRPAGRRQHRRLGRSGRRHDLARPRCLDRRRRPGHVRGQASRPRPAWWSPISTPAVGPDIAVGWRPGCATPSRPVASRCGSSPSSSCPSRNVVGSEALLRWRSADGEVHTPGEFLQIAEDSGLMAAISSRTIGVALRGGRAAGVRAPTAPCRRCR